MSHQIENHAKDLASMLDRGQGERVTQILRDDLYKMSECDFSKLVHATNKYEKNGCGDDLTINPYREKGGPKEHVSVELNRRDKDGLPIVYAETIQSWGNWPGQKPKEVDPTSARQQESWHSNPAGNQESWSSNPARHQESWDPYESPMQRAGYHNWNSANPYQDRFDRNYQDYRYQRPYQEMQPFQSRHQGMRPEDLILPAILGIGLGAAFSLGRNQNHHHNYNHNHNFQSRPHFYPQSYNHAPNFYHAQQRRYW